MKFELKRSAVMVALACLALAGCGGGNDDAAAVQEDTGLTGGVELDQTQRLRWRSRDNVPPTLTIATQTDGPSATMVGLDGTATDNMRLYRVRWANDRGGSGQASLSGTSLSARWSVTAIQLQTGSNTIVLTAEDAAGNTTQAVRDRKSVV